MNQARHYGTDKSVPYKRQKAENRKLKTIFDKGENIWKKKNQIIKTKYLNMAIP